MSKFKPVTRLGHQFGALLSEPKLDAREIAEALIEAELIAYGSATGPDGAPSHYQDTLGRRASSGQYRDLVTDALTSFCRLNGWPYEVAAVGEKQTNPTDHYDPSDFGV